MNNSKESPEIRFAVLIDGDNAQPALVVDVLKEVAKYGKITIRRVYGDWTSRQMETWKKHLPQNAVQPVQQFQYTVGKNATDSAMIIDAMDLLYSNRFDGFCLVSSDSDFTRLATRIREGGITVYGFGKKGTPNAFVSACDKFIYTEILEKQAEEDESEHPAGEEEQAAKKKQTPKLLRGDTKLTNLLRNSVDAVADEDGWAALGNVGQHISNQSPSFDSRNYGFRKLSSLVKATGLFEVESRAVNGESGNRVIFIRHRQRKAQKTGK